MSSLTSWAELEVSHSRSSSRSSSRSGLSAMATADQLTAAIAGLVESQRQQAETQRRLLETLAGNVDANRRRAREDRISKLAPYSDGEEVDTFLNTFEVA